MGRVPIPTGDLKDLKDTVFEVALPFHDFMICRPKALAKESQRLQGRHEIIIAKLLPEDILFHKSIFNRSNLYNVSRSTTDL